MAIVIAGIGIPGAGKTTVLLPFAREHHYIYISPDDLREKITGDAGDQSKNRMVWVEAYRLMREAIAGERSVVFDATLAKREDRQSFVKLARRYGATQVFAVYFEVSMEVAERRNAGRTRVVGSHVLERMHTSLLLDPPSTSDGFDQVYASSELDQLPKS